VCATAHQQRPTTDRRPWSLPLAASALLVLIHLRTNLTTRPLAALCETRLWNLNLQRQLRVDS
jgi:hypothetical protein